MENKTIEELLPDIGVESDDMTGDHIGEATLVVFARPHGGLRRMTKGSAEKEEENNDEN